MVCLSVDSEIKSIRKRSHAKSPVQTAEKRLFFSDISFFRFDINRHPFSGAKATISLERSSKNLFFRFDEYFREKHFV